MLEASTLGAERRLQAVDGLLFEPARRLEPGTVHDAANRPDIPGDRMHERPHSSRVRKIAGEILRIHSRRRELGQ